MKEELVKFALLTRGSADYRTNRHIKPKEATEKLQEHVKLAEIASMFVLTPNQRCLLSGNDEAGLNSRPWGRVAGSHHDDERKLPGICD